MLYIDGKPVPWDPMTGEPLPNIVLVDGQWLFSPNIGKNLTPEYRVVPEKLIRSAVLFEDKATKKKVGYVYGEELTEYINKIEPPRGAGFDQLKKDLANARKDIAETVKWSEYLEASQQRGIMPEITRRGEAFEERYLRSGTPIPDNRYVPINEQGVVKPTTVKPSTSAKPETTLAGGPITPAPFAMDAKDAITARDPWSAISGLDFSEPGSVFDANSNPVFILTETTRSGQRKAYVIPQLEFNAQINTMPKEEIKRYQAALKSAGQWNYEVNGELNYLNRAIFNSALSLAAQGVTEANVLAFNQRSAPKGILEIINEAAKAAGGGVKTTRETYIVNRETAQTALDDIYLNSIGRKANKKEVDEFYQKVQKEAKARPTIRTKTGTDATTRQGFTGDTLTEMAGAQAEARPEFLAYQLSTNFYNALLGASRLPVQFGAGEAPITGPVG
jgi:hypothetical protein